MDIRPEIQALADRIVETRRDLHRHPELGYDLPRTVGLVTERLRATGLEVRTDVGRSGVVADLRGARPGPVIALRADMDALPIEETGTAPYRSVHPGQMHACGHDGHVAMLLGAAEAMAGWRDRIRGGVRFVFQPAEEGLGGAQGMIAHGVMDGVDEIYGAHLWNYNACGEIGVQVGPVMAAADEFHLRVTGVRGHGAIPQGTVDAVVAGAHLISALQTVVSRNVNPLDSAVLTIGCFHAGDNFNVIAGEARLSGTTRAYREEVRQRLVRRLREIAAGVDQAFGTTTEVEYIDGFPPVVNHPAATERLAEAARQVVGVGVVPPYLSMGGEDFSLFARERPGCFFFVGSAPNGLPPGSVPHHCAHFDIDERSLLVGASVFVQLTANRLVDPAGW